MSERTLRHQAIGRKNWRALAGKDEENWRALAGKDEEPTGERRSVGEFEQLTPSRIEQIVADTAKMLAEARSPR